MSRNLAELHRSRRPFTVINGISAASRRRRATQPQGSNALRVETITGYQYLAIPNGVVDPNVAYIDIDSPNSDDIVIATLIRSTFIKYTAGTFINADLESHSLGDDQWNVWMAYDGRADTTLDMAVPVVGGDVIGTMSATSLPLNKARVGIRVSRLTTDSKPGTLDQFLIVYQIRITLG